MAFGKELTNSSIAKEIPALDELISLAVLWPRGLSGAKYPAKRHFRKDLNDYSVAEENFDFS
jgi:hypothetical protein